MALSVKIPFAGLFRGWFRQTEALPAAAPTNVSVASPPSATPPAPAPAAAISTATALHGIHNFPANVNEIEIPLAAVVQSLPAELRAKIMSAPAANATIRLQTNGIVRQLGTGSVKISFGELRRLAPGLIANSGGEHDSRPVSLPLPEILSQLDPALLTRQPTKRISVTDEIAGPFANGGRGVHFTAQPLKASTATPLPAVPLKDFSAKPPPPSAPIAFTPRAITPASVAPAPPLRFNTRSGHDTAYFDAPAPSAPANNSLLVSLVSLAENWPLDLKKEITHPPFAGANLALPEEIVETGLKRGRVTMSWKQIRILVAPNSPASPNDATEVQLPLKIVAPLFLGAKKNLLAAPAKLTVKSEIPDLFFGFPQPAPATAIPGLPTLPKPPAGTPDTNYFAPALQAPAPAAEVGVEENVQTDFTSRQATPKEVVARAIALPGVAGAVVALPDGLRVASEVPSELNPDTLAAFLPQIFERVNQSTRELRLGALNNVSFTVGDVPWKIFRVRSVYFAAFGRVGAGLPSAQLVELAAEIDRKK
jgi:hypothetical protein